LSSNSDSTVILKQTSSTFTDSTTRAASQSRWHALDFQRGMIMTLMAFSHSREYSGLDHYGNTHWDHSPAWLGYGWLDMVQQLLVSSAVAGGFFMMMGVGIFFLWHARLKDGQTPAQIFNYLILRGSLLILLQLTVLEAFEVFTAGKSFFLYAGVFLTLGLGMMGAACCMRLANWLGKQRYSKGKPWEYIIPAIFVIAIPLIMQRLMNPLDGLQPTAWQILVFVTGKFNYQGIVIDINYTLFPWFPAVAMGLIVGKILQARDAQSIQRLKRLTFILLASWFMLRTANLFNWTNFGDYKHLAAGETRSWISWFCASKHPPSISYFLWAFGINLLGITAWYQLEQYVPDFMRRIQFLKIFAQCALFFFIMHWFVYYGLSFFLHEKLTSPVALLGFWLAGLVVLYYFCKIFHKFKFSKPKLSLWRMF